MASNLSFLEEVITPIILFDSMNFFHKFAIIVSHDLGAIMRGLKNGQVLTRFQWGDISSGFESCEFMATHTLLMGEG